MYIFMYYQWVDNFGTPTDSLDIDFILGMRYRVGDTCLAKSCIMHNTNVYVFYSKYINNNNNNSDHNNNNNNNNNSDNNNTFPPDKEGGKMAI